MRVSKFYQSCFRLLLPSSSGSLGLCPQWVLPGLNRALQISVGIARPQPRAPDFSGLPDSQPQGSDLSGHCRTSARRQRESQIKCSEQLPERMPERCQNICQKVCQDRCQIECRIECQNVLPDGMSETMSEECFQGGDHSKKIICLFNFFRNNYTQQTCTSKLAWAEVAAQDRFLRATPVHRVIAHSSRGLLCGDRLESNAGFAHSREVKEISKFISHSWQASHVALVKMGPDIDQKCQKSGKGWATIGPTMAHLEKQLRHFHVKRIQTALLYTLFA